MEMEEVTGYQGSPFTLKDSIGSWGPYQTFVFILAFLVGIFDGMQTILTAFTMAVPHTRCSIPDVDNSTNGTADYSTIFDMNISSSRLGSLMRDAGSNVYCSYCPEGLNQTCGESNNSRTCDNGYLYDKSEYIATLATKFDLVCQRAWLKDLIKSLWMLGVLTGCMFHGIVSDKYGRKVTFICALLGQTLFSVMLPLWDSYYTVASTEFIAGFFSAGVFVIAFVIVMELSEGFPRTIAGMTLQVAFTVGYIADGLVGYFTPDWTHIQWICSAPGIIFISYIWLMPESIKWLVQHGKTGKAVKQIRRAARINKRTCVYGYAPPQLVLEKRERGIKSLLRMFSRPRPACCSALLALNWFSVAMTYYGLSWYTSDLPGNKYVNFFVSGVVEIPAYIFAAIMFECHGRRPSLVISFSMAGLCSVISGCLPNGNMIDSFTFCKDFTHFADRGTLTMVIAMIGKCFISAAFAMIYNYTAEFFPTECRGSGGGLCATCARIGTIAAPQVHLLELYVAHWHPIVVFGAFALTCGALDILLPETKGQNLPDTVEDVVNMMCSLLQGPPGPAGKDGADGKDGKDGKEGADGEPGKNGKILNPETNATYCQICLEGPIGQAGRVGPRGPPGPKGMSGPLGIDGMRGQRGMVGAEGYEGSPGSCGPQGPKGKDGIIIDKLGPAGPPGTRGPPGLTGQRGAKGPNGAFGFLGPPGDTGALGEPGAVGEPGSLGHVGDKGSTGAPGSCDHCPVPRLAPGY